MKKLQHKNGGIQTKHVQQEVELNMKILTPIISTKLNDGEIVSSFVAKKIECVNDSEQLSVGEVYSVLAKTTVAQILRKYYKKGMLLRLKGTLTWMEMEMEKIHWNRKVVFAKEIFLNL